MTRALTVQDLGLQRQISEKICLTELRAFTFTHCASKIQMIWCLLLRQLKKSSASIFITQNGSTLAAGHHITRDDYDTEALVDPYKVCSK